MAMDEAYTKIQKAYRAKFLKLQKKLEKEFKAIADEFDGKIQRLVFKYSRPDGTFDKRFLTEIDREIDAIAYWFTQTGTTWIDKNIVQSVEFAIDSQDMATKAFIRAAAQEYQGKGREMLVKAATDPTAPFLLRTQFGTGLAGYIRKAVWKRRWVDGRALSDRIWETDRALRKNLHDMIEQCVNEGLSAVEFSRAVEQYLLKPGPAWTTKIIPSVTGRGSIKYNALRLARTETNNAYRLAHALGAQNSSIVKGIKWNLSHSHPEPDICDEWATQDLYGLGPGVYPPDKLPPGHPNCLCYLTDVLLEGKELIEVLEGKYQVSVPNTDKSKFKGYNSTSEAFKAVRYTGIEKEFAKQIDDRFLELANQYPIDTQNLKIRGLKKKNEFGHYQGQLNYVKDDILEFKNEIVISNYSMKDYAVSEALHAREAKFRGSKNTSALSTIDHEYAHAIDTAYVLKKNPKLKNEVMSWSGKRVLTQIDADTVNKINLSLIDSQDRLSIRIFNRMKAEYNMSNSDFLEKVEEELGSYAASSRDEFLAEGFSAYRNIPKKEQSEFVKKFGEYFEEYFREVF